MLALGARAQPHTSQIRTDLQPAPAHRPPHLCQQRLPRCVCVGGLAVAGVQKQRQPAQAAVHLLGARVEDGGCMRQQACGTRQQCVSWTLRSSDLWPLPSCPPGGTSPSMALMHLAICSQNRCTSARVAERDCTFMITCTACAGGGSSEQCTTRSAQLAQHLSIWDMLSARAGGCAPAPPAAAAAPKPSPCARIPGPEGCS